MGSSTPYSDVLPSQHPAQGQGNFHPPLSSFRPTSSTPCSTWSLGFGLGRPAASLPVSLVASFQLPSVAALASFSHPTPPGQQNSQSKNDTETLFQLFQEFLQQVSGTEANISPPQQPVFSSMGLPGFPTAPALRQQPLLASQADSMLAAMPFFSPALAGKPGKSPGDLTLSAPVKHLQL